MLLGQPNGAIGPHSLTMDVKRDASCDTDIATNVLISRPHCHQVVPAESYPPSNSKTRRHCHHCYQHFLDYFPRRCPHNDPDLQNNNDLEYIQTGQWNHNLNGSEN